MQIDIKTASRDEIERAIIADPASAMEIILAIASHYRASPGNHEIYDAATEAILEYFDDQNGTAGPIPLARHRAGLASEILLRIGARRDIECMKAKSRKAAQIIELAK